MRVNGYLALDNGDELAGCLVEDALKERYDVESLTLSLTSENGGVARTEAKIKDFAKSSDGDLEIKIPRSVADASDITLKLPTGLKVLSETGVSKVSGNEYKAVGEVSVRFKGPGQIESYWLWIAVIALIIVLAAIAIGRSQSQPRS